MKIYVATSLVLIIGICNSLSCNEWASSVSNECNSNLVSNKGEIFLTKTGTLWNKDTVNNSATSIVYKEYYNSNNDYDSLIAILIVHGGPGYPHIYLDTYKYLACNCINNECISDTNKYRVIFYDQLCVGMSTKQCNSTNVRQYPQLLKMEYYTNEMKSVIDTLIGNKPFHILGQSCGGALVSQFAVTFDSLINSGQVLSLILAQPISPDAKLGAFDIYQQISTLPLKYRNVLQSNDVDNILYEEAMNFYFSMIVLRTSGELPDCVDESFNNINEYIYTNLWSECDWCYEIDKTVNKYALNNHMNLTNDIKNIQIPILYFISEYDMIRASSVILFDQNNDYTTTYLIQSGSHLSHIESFDEVYMLMTCWLDNNCNVPKHDIVAYKNAMDIMKQSTPQFTR